MSGLPSTNVTANRLLAGLAPSDLAFLWPSLSRVNLPVRKQLETPNRAIAAVYFPESGFASVVANSGGRSVEVGLIGREGMTGLAVVMGADRSPNATFMQLAGKGLCVPAPELRSAMRARESLRMAFLRFGHAYIVQTSYTALANGRYKVEERLARWLLMAHDRVDGDDFALTHELMALMLGVRRASITDALDILESKGLVRVRRGCVSVLDRKGLEKLTAGAYGVPEAEFQRLWG